MEVYFPRGSMALLSPRLTSSLIAQFKDLAIEVLGQVSPEFDLSVDERHLAPVRGNVLPHSDTLRQGIANTLALMGIYHERVQFTASAGSVPYQVVSNSLVEGKGWLIWATLNHELAILAEAAPDALLSALERDLWADPSRLKTFFCRKEHHHLGSPAYRLAVGVGTISMVGGPFFQSCQYTSLPLRTGPRRQCYQSAFRKSSWHVPPWRRFSETSDDTRLETLQALLSRYHQAGWQMIVSVHPSGHSMVMEEATSELAAMGSRRLSHADQSGMLGLRRRSREIPGQLCPRQCCEMAGFGRNRFRPSPESVQKCLRFSPATNRGN